MGLALAMLWITAAAAMPPVSMVDGRMLQGMVRNGRNSVLVVNFWATYANGSGAQLQALSALQQRFGGRGLQVICVSRDDPQAMNSHVMPFLSGTPVSFPVYLLTGDADGTIRWFSPTWVGSLPATFIYNRQGQRVAELAGCQPYQVLEQAVVPHL